jgi:hypothetical protein
MMKMMSQLTKFQRPKSTANKTTERGPCGAPFHIWPLFHAPRAG